MIPSLFAVHTNRSKIDTDEEVDFTTGRLHVYQARPCESGGGGTRHDPWDSHSALTPRAYRIAPYRIHVNAEDRYYPAETASFVVEGRFGFSDRHSVDNPVILYDETRGPPPPIEYEYYDDYTHRRGDSCIYRGQWQYSGYTMFSMYCATPIPILMMTDIPAGETIAWPSPNFNRIAVTAGDRVIVRVWTRRWNPATWGAEIDELYEGRRAPRRGAASGGGGAASVLASSPSALASSPSAPLPKFVTDLIIADAVAKRATCPITMEPIRADNATVTSCYHIFDTAALTAWAASQDSTTICPQCRKDL